MPLLIMTQTVLDSLRKVDCSLTFRTHCLAALTNIIQLKLRELLTATEGGSQHGAPTPEALGYPLQRFTTEDLGMDLVQLTERVLHIAEIHLVSASAAAAPALGGAEDTDQLLVTLQRLLAVSAPLLLHTQSQRASTLPPAIPPTLPATLPLTTQTSSKQHAQLQPSDVTTIPTSLYPRFARMWYVISQSYVHPLGLRESVRFAVLTLHYLEDVKEIRSTARLLKQVTKKRIEIITRTAYRLYLIFRQFFTCPNLHSIPSTTTVTLPTSLLMI